MSLTEVDREWVRDEIGVATPPEDFELDDLFTATQSRTLVALRVLRRRYAAAASGANVDSFTLTGVLSVSKKSDLRALDAQINRLQAVYEAETTGTVVSESGASTTHLTRLRAR